MPVQVGSAYGKIDIDASGIKTSIQSAVEAFDKVQAAAKASMEGTAGSLGQAQKAANAMAQGLAQMKASFTSSTPRESIDAYNTARASLDQMRQSIKAVNSEMKSDTIDPAKMQAAFAKMEQSLKSLGTSASSLKQIQLPSLAPSANQSSTAMQHLASVATQGLGAMKDKATQAAVSMGGELSPAIGGVIEMVVQLGSKVAWVVGIIALFVGAVIFIAQKIQEAVDRTMEYSRAVHELGELFGLTGQEALAYAMILKKSNIDVSEGASALNIFVRNMENARFSMQQTAKSGGQALDDLLESHKESMNGMADSLIEQQKEAGANIKQVWKDVAESRKDIQDRTAKSIADIEKSLTKQLLGFERDYGKQLADFRKQEAQAERDYQKSIEALSKERAKALRDIDKDTAKSEAELKKDTAKSEAELNKTRLKDQEGLEKDYAARINAASSEGERALLRRELEAKKAQLLKETDDKKALLLKEAEDKKKALLEEAAERKKVIEEQTKERQAEIEEKRKERQQELAERKAEALEEHQFRIDAAKIEAEERKKAAREAADEQIKAAEKAANKQVEAIEKALAKQQAAYTAAAAKEEARYDKQKKRIDDSMADAKISTPFLKALDTLGISLDDIFGPDGYIKPMGEWFPKVAKAFAGMEDGPKKAAVSMQLFGRSGTDWIPFMERFAAEYDKTLQDLQQSDIKVDPQAAKTYERAWKEFDYELDKIKIRVGNIALPLMTRAMQFMASNGTAALQALQGNFDKAKQTWLDGLSKMLPRTTEFAKNIGDRIGPAMDKWKSAISDKLGDSRRAFDDWWSSTSTFLGELVWKVRTKAEAIAEEMKAGMKQKLEELRTQWEEFWGDADTGTGLLGWLAGIPAKFRTAGENIFNALVAGLDFVKDKVSAALQGPIQALIDIIKKILKIQSPSAVFKDIGKNMMLGLAEGLGANSELPEVKLRKQIEYMVNSTQQRGTNAPSNYRFYGPMYITLSGSNSNMQEFLRQMQAAGAGN